MSKEPQEKFCVNELERRNILIHLNYVAKNYLNQEIDIKTFLHNLELSIKNMDTIEKRLMRDQFECIVHKLSYEFVDPEKLMTPQQQ